MNEVTIFVAIIADLGSFFAPCILPIVPAFLAYISGTTISSLSKSEDQSKVLINKSNVMLNTVFFVSQIIIFGPNLRLPKISHNMWSKNHYVWFNNYDFQ